MLAEIKTKYISSSMQGSPLLNLTTGDLVKALKKVLVEGTNLQSVTSAEVQTLNVVSITIAPGHGFSVNQVVTLTGVSAFSGPKEFRIIETTQLTLKLRSSTTLTNLGKITDTNLSLKVSPLGYDIAFEGSAATGIICFKNKSNKSPAILKVIDALPPNGYSQTWAKFARIVAGQKLNATGGEFTGNEKFPTSVAFPDMEKTGNKVSGETGIFGWMKWDYGLYQSSGYGWTEISEDFYGVYPTDWRIIGDDNTFYLMIRSMGKDYGSYNILSFGLYNSFDASDSGNIVLTGSGRNMPADETHGGQSGMAWRMGFTKVHDYSGNFLFKSILGISQPGLTCTFLGLSPSDGEERHWNSQADLNGLNPVSGKFVTSPIYIKDSNKDLRGTLRGIEQFYGVKELPDNLLLNEGTAIVLNTRKYNGDSGDDDSIPYLFSLKNWEEV